MGNIFQKKQIYITNNDNIYILTDNQGIIKEFSPNIIQYLDYDNSDLKNKFIGIFMNDFMNYLHKEVLLKKYNNMNNLQKKIVHIYLSALSMKRPLIIYDKNKKPHFINLSVNIMADYKNKNISSFFNKNIEYKDNDFLSIMEIIDDNNLFIYTSNFKKITSNFITSKNNVVIICIDFIGSTLQLNEEGVEKTIQINKNFYSDIVFLIKQNYYPYVYLHEIIGDSFVLILNADWTYNIPRYCATLAINFVTELYNLSKDYVNTRIGISYGKIHYGYIGDHFRIFGNTINMASRLENQSIHDKVVIENEFYEKICDEYKFIKNTEDISFLENNMEKKKCLLKGFGEKDCVFINLKNKNQFIHFS